MVDDSQGTVSVVIPHFEAEEYLEEAIQSVLDQNHPQLEILLVDSSDSELAKNYAEKHDNIVYEYQRPNGVSAARNRGIEMASGEYIAFLDADDYWLPKKLEKTVPALSEADVVYTDMYIIRDDALEYYETEQFDTHIQFFRSGLEIPSRTVVACDYVFDDWTFNEELPAREDPNLWTKLLSKYEFKYISEATGVKRFRQGSLTSDPVRHSQAMLDSLDDLVNNFPELKEYEQEVRLRYLEEHALNNQKVGNNRQARMYAFECLNNGKISPILLTVVGCSFLPAGDRILRTLGKIYTP